MVYTVCLEDRSNGTSHVKDIEALDSAAAVQQYKSFLTGTLGVFGPFLTLYVIRQGA